MTEALLSWLLSIPYLLTGFGFLFLAWAAGGHAYALLCGNRPAIASAWYLEVAGAGIFLLIVRIAAGLAMISWIAAVVGVAGLFRPEVVFGLMLPVMVLGLPVAHRFAMFHKPMVLRDRMDFGYYWVKSARIEKILSALIVLAFCGIVVNALIGALVPDMNQDPMWYHLSLPQQWVFAQRFEVYPDIMPSAYPLAVEALYAVIFLLKPDPVLCSLLTAMSGSLLFVGMVAAAFMSVSRARPGAFRGWGVCAVAGVWIPMLTVYGMQAPVQPKNDIIVTLWAFTGAMVLWLPLLSSRCAPSPGWWIVGGFLLGTACSAKPSILIVTFFTFIFAVPLSLYYEKAENRAWPLSSVYGPLLSLLFMALATAPWMYRGYISHGLPLFPLGRSLFPDSAEFEPLFASFDNGHGFAEPTVTGWVAMLSEFPERLAGAAGTGDKAIFFYIIIVCIGLFVGKCRRWRWFSCLLLAQLLLLVGITGAATFRIFAPVYFLATPLLAWVVADFSPRLGRPVRLMLGCLLWAAMLASVGLHQYRLSSFKTFDWEFRPVLSAADVRSYAAHAETGPLALRFSLVDGLIDADERVLLLGSTYPFYLHRDTLWNDEVIGAGGLAGRWKAMGAAEAERFLVNENIDMVLFAGGKGNSRAAGAPLAGLLEAGRVEEVLLPRELNDAEWTLFRVLKK